MTKMSCLPILLSAKKTKKKHGKVADAKNDCPKVKPVDLVDPPPGVAGGERAAKGAPIYDKVAAAATPAEKVTIMAARKGDNGLRRKNSVKGADLPEVEFGFNAATKNSIPLDGDCGDKGGGAGKESGAALEAVVEDATPKLVRSCSNIETKQRRPEMPPRSRSYGDLRDVQHGGLAAAESATPHGEPEASPASVKTSRSADRVMLKKRSSSQVLPSRSRKLWWRLFLWSHRNLHRGPRRPGARPATAAASPSRRGGYTSDTLEEGPAPAVDRKNKKVMVDDSPPAAAVANQWVAFSADCSLLDRVGAWVNSIEQEPFCVTEDDCGDEEEDVARPRTLERGESSGKGHDRSSRRPAAAAADEANTIVQSLNAFSSVAHISGMGLKVMPMIAPFSSLRAVNLSGNLIVHITPGSLPKGLHSLDLSRNKIASIEGLRDLTKLRVLNLSYNRILRIGHGLSSCTAIRELYLAGNKISDVEGLHRLLKLAVLDLSFNKITTAKALGQLVANYHSLLALNLVGNPVQANIGDDALRRAVTGLLPSLAYLNKQPVKPQREVATDSVARAALIGGAAGRGQRRRAASRRPSHKSPHAGADGGARSRTSKARHHASGAPRKSERRETLAMRSAPPACDGIRR